MFISLNDTITNWKKRTTTLSFETTYNLKKLKKNHGVKPFNPQRGSHISAPPLDS